MGSVTISTEEYDGFKRLEEERNELLKNSKRIYICNSYGHMLHLIGIAREIRVTSKNISDVLVKEIGLEDKKIIYNGDYLKLTKNKMLFDRIEGVVLCPYTKDKVKYKRIVKIVEENCTTGD